MSFARVAYPPPPPTHNDLSSDERNNLIRSTKKLGKVLGSTPNVLDVRPTEGHTGRPSLTIVTSSNFTSPIQIIGTGLEHNRPSHPRRSASVSSTSTTMSDESNDTRFSLSSGRSDTESLTSAESWRPRKVVRKPPPSYQQTRSPSPASIKPLLETIPASPPFDTVPEDEAVGGHKRSISFASFGPPRPLSEDESAEFEIPSDASIRLSKMERVRRKLGDGVPVELVFPDEESAPEELQGQEGLPPIEETRRWTQRERSRRKSVDAHALSSSPSSSAVVSRPASMSRASPSATSALSRSDSMVSKSSKSSKSTTNESKIKSGFSLQRPLFAVVAPDDYITGCFEFSLRKHRAAYIKEFGKQSALE
ncbi:hypothetical protein FIBSPDRAFT_1040566 [Athelia psychrophila]|uniref:Uncharacterized protein n=1 Tax=Athelia psychrophila TaxID=1759441 RepID=A0A166Q6V8_9AGAM|nr:hypothetical protein FIBSPDRAFT_1040566 [Fibularhizoctonia sp. CBS 109695]